MSLLRIFRRLVSDPPPEYVFEISEKGIAWARTAEPRDQKWQPLEEGAIKVSPLKDNVLEPRAFEKAVAAIAPPGAPRKQRRAALILPDYCARVVVLDFDTFPADPAEQAALARFRVKRAVPFDIESAVLACHPQPRHDGSKKIDVAVAVLNMEVAAHYEAPFRAAGYHCGFVTLSALAALPMGDGAARGAPVVVAKWSGMALAVSLIHDSVLRMFRCVELGGDPEHEVVEVLGPTFALAEDDFNARPQSLRLCGFPPLAGDTLARWQSELGAEIETVKSRFGEPAPYNAGLLGYLETLERN
jgi:type IV pilus assembly protein PilM